MSDWHQLPHLTSSLLFWEEGYRIPLLICDTFYAATSEYIVLQGRITDDNELERSWIEGVMI